MLLCKLCAEETINVKDRRSLASQKSEGVRAVLGEALIQHGCVQDNVKQHISSGHLCKKCFILLEKRWKLQHDLHHVDQLAL